MKDELVADTRWIGPHGIGRFAREVLVRIPHRPLPLGGRPTDPLDPFRVGLYLFRARPRLYFSPGFNPPWPPRGSFVLTVHDLIPLRFGSSFHRTYFHTLLRPALKRARRVLTVSEFSRREIAAWAGLPPEKVVVVGGGVGEAFRPEGPKGDLGFPYLLYVGAHKPHKNLERLVEAFALARLPGVRLALTGRPEEALLLRAKAHGVEGRLVFLGLVPEEELPALYRGALALVFPSLYEGFGLPPLEAMACGTPVVASNRASIPEVVGDAGLLVDPYQVEALAEALRRVVEDEPLRAELRAKGLARSRLFSWDGVAERVKATLCEAMEEG